MFNGVLWVLGTGAQWRELPRKYPSYQTCHRRFLQWVSDGKLEKILHLLATKLPARGQWPLDEAFIAAIEQRIQEKLKPCAAQLTLLDEIPGLDWSLAAVIIAELGVDISVFQSVSQVASWAWICP